MFPDAMNSFDIVLWYTYTCSNNTFNTIKQSFAKIIKMTTNTEYVAPRAEELKLTFQTEADLRFASYKATHDINKSRKKHAMRACVLCFVVFFCFRNDCLENACIHVILEARQQCI